MTADRSTSPTSRAASCAPTAARAFPKARYFFLNIRDAKKGRAFVEALRPTITTAARWKNPDRGEPLVRTRNPRVKDVVRAEGVPDYPGEVQLMKPKVTINIAFTFQGLFALERADADPARHARRIHRRAWRRAPPCSATISGSTAATPSGATRTATSGSTCSSRSTPR